MQRGRSPDITSDHWKLERAGVISLPLPGRAPKFVPVGGERWRASWSCGCAAPSVIPGCRCAPQRTAQGLLVTGHDRDEVGVPGFPTAQALALARPRCRPCMPGGGV